MNYLYYTVSVELKVGSIMKYLYYTVSDGTKAKYANT